MSITEFPNDESIDENPSELYLGMEDSRAPPGAQVVSASLL